MPLKNKFSFVALQLLLKFGAWHDKDFRLSRSKSVAFSVESTETGDMFHILNASVII